MTIAPLQLQSHFTPGVGSLAPEILLPDQRGELLSLATLLSTGPAVLVFYRGHWCPYCRRYLCKIQANQSRFQTLGVSVVAISSEPCGTSAALAAELGLQFPLLSDADGQVINRYGTRNSFLGGSSALPHPSVFLVDQSGVVRLKSIDRNFKRRTTMRTIFQAIDALLLPA